MIKTKLKIQYLFCDVDLYSKIEKDLLNEGWEKGNHTLIVNEEKAKAGTLLTTWFERDWN